MIQVNQKVVCVNDEFPAWARAIYTDLPVKDKVYTIRQILPGCEVTHIVKNTEQPLTFSGVKNYTVYLKEITNPIHPVSRQEMGYLLNRFIPLDQFDNSEEEEESIQTPTKSKKPVVVERELTNV